MAQSPGDDKTEPSLELPSLKLPGLGRRRREKKPREAASTADAPPEEPRNEAEDEPTQSWDRAATGALPVNGRGEHAAGPAVPATAPATAPATPRASAPATERASAPAAAQPSAPATAQASAPATATEVPARPAGRARTRLVLPGRLAAALTGLLVGAAGAALTYGAMAACEAVRGVSSCGGVPGFFVLVAIVVLMVLLGAGLLKAFGVKDTVSTSFLGVGIVTVLVMLLLLDVIFSAWMFAAIPVLTAAAYLLAHWVTTRFEGEDTGRRDWR